MGREGRLAQTMRERQTDRQRHRERRGIKRERGGGDHRQRRRD